MSLPACGICPFPAMQQSWLGEQSAGVQEGQGSNIGMGSRERQKGSTPLAKLKKGATAYTTTTMYQRHGGYSSGITATPARPLTPASLQVLYPLSILTPYPTNAPCT